MSKIIQCIDNTHPVVIKATINTGASIWKYDYVDRGTTYSGRQADGMPHVHAIGFPHELNMVSDAWSILLINSSNDNLGYRITIQWFQGDVMIGEWTDEGNIAAGDSAQPNDSCIFLEQKN